MTGVHAPDEGGAITLRGRKMKGKATERIDESIRAIQMVFQNPDSALNRAWTVRQILTRSITKLTGLKAEAADKRAVEIAMAMRLNERHLDADPGRCRVV